MSDAYSWGNTWPPSPIERELRAELDRATRKVRAVEALVLKFRARDGLVPACQILNAFLLIDEEHRP